MPLPEWRKKTGKERANLLRALFNEMMENQEDLAQIITAEGGKPLAKSRGEVAYGASFIEWFAEEAKRTYGDVIPTTMPGRQIIVTTITATVFVCCPPLTIPEDHLNEGLDILCETLLEVTNK